jgi:hypothetical protein
MGTIGWLLALTFPTSMLCVILLLCALQPFHSELPWDWKVLSV